MGQNFGEKDLKLEKKSSTLNPIICSMTDLHPPLFSQSPHPPHCPLSLRGGLTHPQAQQST